MRCVALHAYSNSSWMVPSSRDRVIAVARHVSSCFEGPLVVDVVWRGVAGRSWWFASHTSHGNMLLAHTTWAGYNEVGQLGKAGTMDNGSIIPGVNGVDACFGSLSVGLSRCLHPPPVHPRSPTDSATAPSWASLLPCSHPRTSPDRPRVPITFTLCSCGPSADTSACVCVPGWIRRWVRCKRAGKDRA